VSQQIIHQSLLPFLEDASFQRCSCCFHNAPELSTFSP
jgi:hypothetical protein